MTSVAGKLASMCHKFCTDLQGGEGQGRGEGRRGGTGGGGGRGGGRSGGFWRGLYTLKLLVSVMPSCCSSAVQQRSTGLERWLELNSSRNLMDGNWEVLCGVAIVVVMHIGKL